VLSLVRLNLIGSIKSEGKEVYCALTIAVDLFSCRQCLILRLKLASAKAMKLGIVDVKSSLLRKSAMLDFSSL